MLWFWIIRHKLKITECEYIIWGTETMLSVSFIYAMCLLKRLLMLLPVRHCILHIDIKSEPKIWMHIKHCVNSAKAKAIQEAQNMYCVDEAATDAENLCKWCLASLVDIVFRIFVPTSFEPLCKTYTMCHTRFILSINHRKRILYSCHRNLLQILDFDQEFSLLVIKLTTLRRKIIQRSIFFDNDLFSSSGFLHI